MHKTFYNKRFLIIKMGVRVGKYEVIGMLGRGRSGEVYEAGHIKNPDFLKAVKVYRNMDSLLREEEAYRKLGNHPHIVAPEIGGFYPDHNPPGLVMELMQSSIRHLMHNVSEADAIDIMIQALEGLSHAHKMGVIHRDIKPENILINKEGIVKIGDFGAYKAIEDVICSITSGETSLGMEKGTLLYVAPEQISGKSSKQSDVYSSGLVLCELVIKEDLRRIIDREQILLDEAQIRDIRNKELRRIVSKATAYNPNDRYSDAGSMLEDLLRLKPQISIEKRVKALAEKLGVEGLGEREPEKYNPKARELLEKAKRMKKELHFVDALRFSTEAFKIDLLDDKVYEFAKYMAEHYNPRLHGAQAREFVKRFYRLEKARNELIKDNLMLEGRQLYESEDFKEAKEIFEKVVRLEKEEDLFHEVTRCKSAKMYAEVCSVLADTGRLDNQGYYETVFKKLEKIIFKVLNPSRTMPTPYNTGTSYIHQAELLISLQKKIHQYAGKDFFIGDIDIRDKLKKIDELINEKKADDFELVTIYLKEKTFSGKEDVLAHFEALVKLWEDFHKLSKI